MTTSHAPPRSCPPPDRRPRSVQLKRLQHLEPRIYGQAAIRFAVARGPLNIAGFLLGNTEFRSG